MFCILRLFKKRQDTVNQETRKKKSINKQKQGTCLEFAGTVGGSGPTIA